MQFLVTRSAQSSNKPSRTRQLLRGLVASVVALALVVVGLVGPASAAEQDNNPDLTLGSGFWNDDNAPYGIAIDGDNNVYVSVPGGRSTPGSTISLFKDGGSKTTPVQISVPGIVKPRGMAFNSDRTKLYVANQGANNILVIDVSTPESPSLVRTLQGTDDAKLELPNDVAVDSEGTVYAVNYYDNSVIVFDANQTTPNPNKTLTGASGDKFTGAATDSNDKVYVISYNNGGKVFNKGSQTPSSTLTGLTNPVGIAINNNDELYVTNMMGNTVSVFDAGTTAPNPLRSLGGPFLVGPSMVAITDAPDADDTDIYVVGQSYRHESVLGYDYMPAPDPDDFVCTGSEQSYTAPDWASKIKVTLKGAQGGGGNGGLGAQATAIVDVTSDKNIYVNVGCSPTEDAPGVGGFNGGGNAGDPGSSTGGHLGAFHGGGGATDIRIGDNLVSDRVFVAGGGGGEQVHGTSAVYDGGNGGDPSGGAGEADTGFAGAGVGYPGLGGTTNAGGAGGVKATSSEGTNGHPGEPGVGGDGGDSHATNQTGPGAGGGGGLFGGGGGGAGHHGVIPLLGHGIGGAGGGGSSGLAAKASLVQGLITYGPSNHEGSGAVDITPLADNLEITTEERLPNANQGAAYSEQFEARGGTDERVWSASGNVPPGLSMSAAGVLSGTPTQAGSYSFAVKVVSDGDEAENTFKILVNPELKITTSSLPNAKQGTAYSATLTDTGAQGSVAWQIESGSLPAGLKLDAHTGVISGTPTKAQNQSFTVRVVDDNARSASKALSIAVSSNKPVPAKTKQTLRKGTIPAKLRNPGRTLVNKAGAKTSQGRPLSARVSVRMRGEMYCLRVSQGKRRAVSVRSTGKCSMTVSVTYRAPGTASLRPFKKTVKYKMKRVR